MTTKSGTSWVGPKQATSVLHATRFANDNGRPLNVMVTIDFSTLGIDPDNASEFFKIVRASVSRWWSYQRQKGTLKGPFTCYAVHEHPAGGPRHVHWVLYVPASHRLAVEAVVRKRVEKYSRLDCLGKAIHFLDVSRAEGVAKYTLKGVHPAYGDHFYIEPYDQGFVTGRRITVSRGIGAAARKQAGWSRTRTHSSIRRKPE